MSDPKEIEFKYYAHEIPREKFDSIVKEIGGIKKDLLLFADADNGKDSVDHYFSHYDDDCNRFMRWREGQDKNGNKTWELTSKSRTSDKNNNVRTETNISLNAKDMNLGKAKSFSAEHELEYDFSIKKNVQIYWMEEPIVLSHYTTFDLDGNQLHDFMEIEADEKHPWESEEQALDAITEWEKKLSELGISAQKRIKKSLYDFYSGKLKPSNKIKELLSL